MADSSEIDNALVALLGADATLLSYVPNGVHFAHAPDNSTRYVIVSIVEERDERIFDGRSHESVLYNVEVNILKSTNGNPKAAFARVDALLEGGTLTIPGYSLMAMYRESRDRQVEVDEADASIVWFRRSGMYRVEAALVS